PGAEGAARLEHGARPIEIDAVADIGIRLGLAAYHSGEVEDGAGALVDQLAHRCRFGNVAGDNLEPLVGGERRRGGRVVEEHEFVDRRLAPIGTGQRAPLQQALRQAPADEAGTAGDDDPHRAPLRRLLAGPPKRLPLVLTVTPEGNKRETRSPEARASTAS